MGILWRLSGTIQRADDDTRLGGALAYFFDPTTTTPRNTYTTAALSVPHTHPIEADANGRWPAVYLQYGTYRERLCEPWLVEDVTPGSVITDFDSIPNPEPPEDDPGVSDEALFITGRGFWSPFDEAVDGYVRCNARTIGSALSGASERAHADCEDLFLKLWNGLSDTVCPVTTGRGASAALDWAANKKIALPDLRGSVPGGLDTMGNAAGSRFDASVPFSVGNATTAGSVAGLNHHVITAAQLPTITPAGTISQITPAGTISQITPAGTISQITPAGTNSTPTITGQGTGVVVKNGVGPFATTPGGAQWIDSATLTLSGAPIFTGTPTTPTFTGTPTTPTFTGTPTTPTFTGTSFGTDAAHNNTQRTMLGTFYLKL